MWVAIEIGLGIYVAIVCCIFAFQRHLMYLPSKAILAPDAYGLGGMEELTLDAEDGVRLQAWAHPARTDMPTIVYFHGNAGHIGDRAAKFAGFLEAGFGLVAVSYRGYGKSGDSPTESGLYKDARAAVAYVRQTLRLPPSRIVYFGESLGSGVAVQMASEQVPGLLMLEAAYTSVETRSAELYPYILGVRGLVLDKYDSLSKIARVRCPVLMVHGQLDTVIPLVHAERLFTQANEPKQLIVYPQVHHVDYANPQLVIPLLGALKKYGLVT